MVGGVGACDAVVTPHAHRTDLLGNRLHPVSPSASLKIASCVPNNFSWLERTYRRALSGIRYSVQVPRLICTDLERMLICHGSASIAMETSIWDVVLARDCIHWIVYEWNASWWRHEMESGNVLLCYFCPWSLWCQTECPLHHSCAAVLTWCRYIRASLSWTPWPLPADARIIGQVLLRMTPKNSKKWLQDDFRDASPIDSSIAREHRRHKLSSEAAVLGREPFGGVRCVGYGGSGEKIWPTIYDCVETSLAPWPPT